MKPSIQIREVQVKEIPALLKLFREAVLSIPDYSPKLRKLFLHKYRSEIVRKRITQKSSLCLVAISDGKLVGFCWGMSAKPTQDGVYWMNWIGVTKSYRRLGVAGKLIRHLEQVLRTNRFHKIWFNIDPKNKRSAKTFRALGYRQLVRVRNHWYGSDALLWEKSLSKKK